MGKLTTPQIREHERQKLEKSYKERISNLERSVEYWKDKSYEINSRITKFQSLNEKLVEENETLKEKVRQYEEWIDRLQEFCNMPEDERINAVEKFKTELETSEAIKNLFNSPFMNYFSSLSSMFI